MTFKDATGKPLSDKGKYVTVWKKQRRHLEGVTGYFQHRFAADRWNLGSRLAVEHRKSVS
jgi:hypothetical protein